MLSYEEKRRRLKKLYYAIKKAEEHLLLEQAETWLKRFANEPWYEAAVKAYAAIAMETGGVFQDHKHKVLEAIGRNDLFEEVPEISISGGIKRKRQGITRYKTWEYLDERYNRVVVDDVRDELAELQKDFRQKLDQCYQKVMIDTLVPEAGKALYDHLAMTFDFNRYDEATRDYLRDKKIRWRNQVADETEREIKAQLVKGYEEGLSSYAIAENIGQSSGFKLERAEKIARTEVMSACNYAQYAAADINDDVVGHYWRSQGTARSRMSHRRANGQYRPKGEPFTIGGAKMMYPGDGSLGAPAKEIINCRCWLEMVFVGEEPAGLTRTTLDDKITSGALDRYSKEADEHAERYYQLVRSMTTDCQRIAANTGYTEKEIRKIKDFIFLEEHDLWDGRHRFDASYEMAESWRRLIDGKNIQSHDLVLLQHERLESELMANGISQNEAHILASKQYDYSREANIYYDSRRKHKKRK